MVAELVVVKGSHRGEFVQIHQGPITIGRSRSAELVLDQDTKISSLHCRIAPLGNERYLLEDLGSTNGTFVNEERVETCPLRSGDLVKAGRSLMIFRTEGPDVHLSDVDLADGGSSANVRPDASSKVSWHAEPGATASDPDAPGDPSPVPEQAPPPDFSGPPPAAAGDVVEQSLQELILSAGEPEFSRGLHRQLEALLEGTGGGRAMVFLRHPHTGGLGGAATQAAEAFPQNQPVDPQLLQAAARGEFVAEARGAAAPVAVAGAPVGAVYLDASPTQTLDEAVALKLVSAAGIQVGALLQADRSKRLAASAIEIVGLAQAQVNRRPVDLGNLLQGTERLFAGAAARRNVNWRLEVGPGVMALVDPLLLGRGIDTLVQHVLSVARREVVISAGAGGDGATIHVRVTRDRVEPPESVALLVDPEGVAADLRRAASALDDGTLAVARVALLRAGGRFNVSPDAEGVRVVYALDLELAGGSQ